MLRYCGQVVLSSSVFCWCFATTNLSAVFGKVPHTDYTDTRHNAMTVDLVTPSHWSRNKVYSEGSVQCLNDQANSLGLAGLRQAGPPKPEIQEIKIEVIDWRLFLFMQSTKNNLWCVIQWVINLVTWFKLKRAWPWCRDCIRPMPRTWGRAIGPRGRDRAP